MSNNVVSFRRSAPSPTAAPVSSAAPAAPGAWPRWEWRLAGAACASLAAILAALRWPARLALRLGGAVGAASAVAIVVLTSPVNVTRLIFAVGLFLVCVALWHAGEGLLNWSRRYASIAFDRAKKNPGG